MAASIEREIQNLRRENRRMKVAGLLALAGALVLFACSRGEQKAEAQGKVADEVRARKFVVVDGRGRERIKLFMSPSGSPAIGILDAKGKDRIALYVSGEDDNAQLRLIGKTGKTEVFAHSASLSKKLSPGMSISSPGLINRLDLGASDNISFITMGGNDKDVVSIGGWVKGGVPNGNIFLHGQTKGNAIGLQSIGDEGSVTKD